MTDIKTNNDVKMVFLLCDDEAENYYVGQFARYPSEIKPALSALAVGGYLATSPTKGIMRKT